MSWSQEGQRVSVAAAIALAWPRHAAKEVARATGASVRTAKRIVASGRVSSRWAEAFWAALERQLAYHERRAAELRRQVEENRHAALAAPAPLAAPGGGGGAPGGEARGGEVSPPR
jgi:hypothetical protein